MLKRRDARLCLGFFYSGAALLLVGQGLGRLAADTFLEGFGEGLTIGAVILLVLAGLVLSFRLRCPNCGKRYARPRWNVFHTDYCTHCKKPFVYDDEIGEDGP